MVPAPEQVVAVVVAFHPDARALETLVAAARSQVAALVVVDNTPSDAPSAAPALPGVDYIRLGFNAGLAVGLNRGCDWARQRGAKAILLFDQDSVPAPDMLHQLLCAWRAAEASGNRVAAAGPRIGDTRGARLYSFQRVGILRNRVIEPDPAHEFVLTDTLITSGCLVSVAALDDVGGMNESLFIDSVDIEWGFRAMNRGWTLAGAPRALLEHRLGDDHVAGPWWARPFGKGVAVRYGPVRLYYIIRNKIRLLWMPHVPLAWKVQDVLRLPAKIALCLWLAKDRPAAAAAMARAVAHGLANRGGAMR